MSEAWALPREPTSPKDLQKAFPFHGYIERAEHRAIKTIQIRRFVDFASTSCSTLAVPELSAAELNFYHLNEFLILPACQEHQCSAVELVECKPQSPLVFISHWWGSKIKHFPDCLEHYSRRKEFKQEVLFWIFAFAERHPRKHLQEGPDAGFIGALALADCFLLMLGKGDQVSTFFSRTWCLFEVERAIREKKVMDFALQDPPDVLVETFFDQVGQMEKKTPRSEARSISMREHPFPIQAIEPGLQLDIRTSQASNKEDYERILQAVAGFEPSHLPEPGEARTSQERFCKFNRRLRGELALAMWYQVIQQGLADPKRLARVILADEERTTLNKNFSHSNFGDYHLAQLAAALPSNLLHLQLSLWSSQIGTPGIRALSKSLSQLKHLETLTLDCQMCSRIGQTGVDALGLCLPTTITVLRLNFHGAFAVRNILGLAKGIANLRNLRVLSIDIGGIENMDHRQVRTIAESFPPRLMNLHLGLRGCPYFTSSGVQSMVLSLPPEMSMLSLNFSVCDRINNDAVRWLAFKMPRMLKVLQIDLSDCVQVDDTSVLLLMQKLPSALKGVTIKLAGTRVSLPIQRAGRKLETIRRLLDSQERKNGQRPTESTEKNRHNNHDRHGRVQVCLSNLFVPFPFCSTSCRVCSRHP
ncbi:unnamed protein product [Durusdinium trenchii]|uniref:Uncharacterized protein n=1 Tax=Durusdinium trenchii TaxID=1381693 RepID=A0ABP0H6V0_9DINO